jgi:hypothetical protein
VKPLRVVICSDSAAMLSSEDEQVGLGRLVCVDDGEVSGIGEDGSDGKLLLGSRPCGCGG